MALNEFKPEIWTPRILRTFDKQFVFGNVVNRDYEGEISQLGDSVKINQIGEISVSNYGSTGLGTPPELTDMGLSLNIDQAKKWQFRVEDIDRMQAIPGVMDEAMRKAGIAIADTIDQHIAGFYTDNGYSTSTGTGSTGAAISVSSTDVAEIVLEMGELLNDNNVPTAGRWMVIPPWFMRRLVLSKVLAGGNYIDEPNSASIGTGMVGSALGFNFYMSNNVSKGSTHSRVMFGTNEAITHASQISKVESFRSHDYFADVVRGLYLYGTKVVKPAALGTLYCYAA